MIHLDQVSARAGSFMLSNVSFEVPAGGYGVVIGPAGSGKTTLLETIAGVVASVAGTIHIESRDATRLPVNQRGTGLVYQHAYLFPHLSVQQNVAYGERDPGAADEMLRLFDIMSLGDRSVESLSGGERQLVALARALAQRPQVLLLDEPFSALDPKRRALTRRLVRELQRQRGITILQVTHDFAEAGLLGDVAILLDQGKVLQHGSAADVFRRPASPYIAEFLGAENVLAGEARAAPADISEIAPDGPLAAPLRPMEFVSGSLTILGMGDVDEGPCHAVIRAGEVVVSRAQQRTSARNQFQGTVSEVAILGAYARITVDVGEIPLVALLTIPSVVELEIEPGVEVQLGFKAFAVHLC